MGLRVIVVEPDEQERDNLKYHLEFHGLEVMCEAGSFEDVETMIQEQKGDADAAFINTHLPTSDGFYCAYFLRTRLPDIRILFLSAYPETAVTAFEYGALDYIPLPMDTLRLEQAIDRLKTLYLNADSAAVRPVGERIMVRLRSQYRMVDIDDILFLEVRNRKCRMVFGGKELELQGYTMEALEKMLAPFGFFRCYQSILVHISKISQLMADGEHRAYFVQMKGREELLPVSRDKYAELVGLLQESSNLIMDGIGDYGHKKGDRK